MSQPDYDQIRKRITDRYNNRMGFFSHLIAFLVANGAVWSFWLATPENARSGILSLLLVIVSVGWLIGMSIHTVIYMMS